MSYNWNHAVLVLLCLPYFTSIMSSRFIHVTRKAEWCSIVCICHVFFVQSPVDGHLSCFHVFAIVNSCSEHKNDNISLKKRILNLWSK